METPEDYFRRAQDALKTAQSDAEATGMAPSISLHAKDAFVEAVEEGVVPPGVDIKDVRRAAAGVYARRVIDRIDSAKRIEQGVIVNRAESGASILEEPEMVDPIWGKSDRVGWSSGEGCMLASQQSLGKSTIAQQLILHRIGILEGDFLGMPVQRDDRPVVYLAMDRPRQVKRSMRRMVLPEHEATLAKQLVIWSGPMPFHLPDNPQRMAEWLGEIAPGYGTVVIDSVKDMAAGLSKDEIGASINTAWQEIIAGGAEVLALHHQRKAGNGESRVNTLDDVYGSTWLTSGLGSVFALEGEPGAQLVKLRHLKSPMEQLQDIDVHHDLASGRSTVHSIETVEFLEAVAGAGDEGITAEEAAKLSLGATGEQEKRKAKYELGKMVKAGTVEKVKGRLAAEGRIPDRWRISKKHEVQADVVQSWVG